MSDANPDQQPTRITVTRSGTALASGRWSVVALVVCFIITAILIPRAAHLPRWVEVELVIAAWWLVWVFALAYLLYSTLGVSDDAPYAKTPGWFALRRKKVSDGCTSLPDIPLIYAGDLGEGCGGFLFVIACAAFIGIGLWLMIELVVPGLAFLMYILVRGMIARATASHNDCRGSVIRSIGWGTVWASVYTLPLGLAVWAIHAFAIHHK